MAAPIKIRLASRAYDGTLPILRGQKSIPGFEFDITETEDVPGMFAGMFKGQYDVSEMSLGELIYYTSSEQSRLRRDAGFSVAHVSSWLYFLSGKIPALTNPRI